MRSARVGTRVEYWSVGVPVLLAVQVVLAALSAERPSRLPLWLLAGHFAAMLLVHPAGTSLALLPIAIVFIGLPAYGGLYE